MRLWGGGWFVRVVQKVVQGWCLCCLCKPTMQSTSARVRSLPSPPSYIHAPTRVIGAGCEQDGVVAPLCGVAVELVQVRRGAIGQRCYCWVRDSVTSSGFLHYDSGGIIITGECHCHLHVVKDDWIWWNSAVFTQGLLLVLGCNGD